MKIRNIVHGPLRRFHEYGATRGLRPEHVWKLRHMLTFLQVMHGPEKLHTLRMWKAHQLYGSREGTWSFYVTRNWRLTFFIDHDTHSICDVNFEDYY